MIPGTLIIKLSWATIISEYKPLDTYGNISGVYGQRYAPKLRGKAPEGLK